jgi:hypothetical protein
VAWDGGFEEDFVVPVMDLMREFLEKTAGGWKPCKLDELEEFKSRPMGLFSKTEKGSRKEGKGKGLYLWRKGYSALLVLLK